MTPKILRTIAWVAGAIALLLAILAVTGDESSFERPTTAIFFALLAMAALLLSRRGGGGKPS